MIRSIQSMSLLFLLAPFSIEAGDNVEYSSSINFDVEVSLTCTLSTYTSQVDFGEIHKKELSASGLTRDVSMIFSGCNAENADVSFSGENISDDGSFLKNRAGDGQASGVKITFQQDGSPVNLHQQITQNSPREGDAFKLSAILEPMDGEKIRSGLISTSLDIVVAYR
ncbi:fimbrial protein [Raoultella planticola]|uniref:fimbrial protein n=1 Tax=Raoultella TaxID=160674 RepID=UPI0007DAC5D4|nr:MULTISPECIES: fimbrial protein [Raoultella]WPJ11291.1 fimbrial protein [Raoultella ornithinolytica]HDH7823031.1 fimbrial protein [Raoultella planticola]